MSKRTVLCMAAALGLGLLADTAPANVILIDFGNAPKQDTSNTFSYSFGNATSARSYDADNLIIDSTYGVGYAVSGNGIGGDFSGTGSFIGDPLPAELLSNPILMEGALTYTAGTSFDPEQDIWDVKVVLVPVGGTAPGNLTYHFVRQRNDLSGISQGVGAPGVKDVWVGTLTSGTPSAGFVVNQVQFVLQNGDLTGTSQLLVDNLQVAPEPASAMLLAIGGLALAAQRRARTQ